MTNPSDPYINYAFRLSSDCGNGVLEPGEQCDDGNITNGDGCSAVCQIETGWTCTGQPSVCTAPNGQACTTNTQCTSGTCTAGACACATSPFTQIIDSTGDGTHPLSYPNQGIAVDASGNVYLGGAHSNNAFKITPDGTITQILDSSGDGSHSIAGGVQSVAVDGSKNVYVGGNYGSGVFKITPGGAILQIIGGAGDGTHVLSYASALAVDGNGNVYVAGYYSSNAFKVTPGGVITQIIDSTGDGTHAFSNPLGIAVDDSGNVYAPGAGSNNAFKITPSGSITQIIDHTGDGTHALTQAQGLAADGSGNAYVAGGASNNVFKITPAGTITQIIDSTGDGTHALSGLNAIAVDAGGNVYVPAFYTSNAFMITPAGSITQIIDGTGDGTHALSNALGVAVSDGKAYVTGASSNNAFKISVAANGTACVCGSQCLSGSCVADVCVAVCGNGVLDPGEQCDDGNTVSGDGCSSTCQIETGWACAGQPSVCTAPNGQACGSDGLCTSGFCVDGVCCDTACGGGVSNDCQACSIAAGASIDGTCSGLTGTACDDGNACTQTDTCQSGACVGGNPVTCGASDQCHAGTCNPSTGTCSQLNKPNGSACNDGDGCPADTCQAGVCHPVACPNVDAVVLVPKPVTVVIPATKTEVGKKLAVTVRNADTTDRTIQLQVDAADCPAGSVGAVNFGGGQDSVLVKAGKIKKASLPLIIRSADFTSFNFKAPTRCTLLFTASAVVTGGSNDPNPSNNHAVVELNVVNKHNPEQTGTHETTIQSTAPTTVTIARKAATATKKLTAVVGNADYRPAAEKPGDPITLQTSASCSGVTLSPPVCDPTAGSATATVKGGATKTCKLTATVDAAQISTPNKLSPQRCMVTLTAVGPTHPEVAPLDPSNTSTELTIDITDGNDF